VDLVAIRGKATIRGAIEYLLASTAIDMILGEGGTAMERMRKM